MLARLDYCTYSIAVAPVRRLKIADDRRRAITLRIAGLMRRAEPTPFSAEGPARAGLRAALCLKGWRWTVADRLAAEIVAAALALVGAKRPSWAEGQRAFTTDGAWREERERCVRCFKPLPEGHVIYCGRLCGNAHRRAQETARRREEIAVAAFACDAVG